MRSSPSRTRGYSLIGLLLGMACIVVLMAISLTALNKAVTGEGSTRELTVHSMQDKLALYELYQSMAVHAMDNKGRLLVPSEFDRTGDRSHDTTANLFSAMIGERYTSPAKLISANERSAYVWEIENYNYFAISPRNGVFWDPRFKADLLELSNTSYAHMPLTPKRLDRFWNTSGSSTYPLLGNRGPRDGRPDPASVTYGRDGTWAGHLVFGDGHVDFISTFSIPGLTVDLEEGRKPDNPFAMESGAHGTDAVISFTRAMTGDGPELQYD